MRGHCIRGEEVPLYPLLCLFCFLDTRRAVLCHLPHAPALMCCLSTGPEPKLGTSHSSTLHEVMILGSHYSKDGVSHTQHAFVSHTGRQHCGYLYTLQHCLPSTSRQDSDQNRIYKEYNLVDTAEGHTFKL